MTIEDIKQLLFSQEMKDQIREVVREEVEVEFDRRFNDLSYQLNILKLENAQRANDLESRLKNVEIDLKRIHKELSATHKDINLVIDTFNKDDLKIQQRIDKIELRMGHTSML